MEINIVLEGHEYYNEAQTMVQVFYPNCKYIRAMDVSASSVTVKSAFDYGRCVASVFENGLFLCSHEAHAESDEKAAMKNAVKTSIYEALAEHTGYRPKWGILTGIRPAKLASAMLSEGKTGRRIMEIFGEAYLVSPEKARLALAVAENGRRIMRAYSNVPENAVNLYVGIPFCPSRCLYCSFTSEPYGESRADLYLERLMRELSSFPDLPLNSVYIGGGTPTSLNNRQLRMLLSAIGEKFDMKGVEYTVEAGRPDTITREKLETIKQYGVNRLSINPQTMNDETLVLIGRKHSSDDISKAFYLAREIGFDNINMDLILGLPKETLEMVSNTFERVLTHSPESITVHTLSVKRASRLNEELESHSLAKHAEIEDMLTVSAEYAAKMGMFPYSMYRQKNMLGNFENIGWCREGKHSVFNIETLEETRTILAAGAGAVTKEVSGDKISRRFNVKNVDEYMKRLDGNDSLYI